jgi:hypothetical protein
VTNFLSFLRPFYWSIALSEGGGGRSQEIVRKREESVTRTTRKKRYEVARRSPVRISVPQDN